MRYVYVAGPLTKGDVGENVRLACRAGSKLMREGLVPYVPHLSHFQDIVAPGGDYEDWMRLDFAWIERCDALVRLPGESSGADREVAFARERGIPVYFGVDALLAARLTTEVTA